MAKIKPKTVERKLNDYIWSLRGKCDGITEVNRELINQYCRYALMAEELSIKIKNNFDAGEYTGIDEDIKLYEKLNKLTLGLYKTLKLEQVKDELAEFGNPFMELMKEEETDGDL